MKQEALLRNEPLQKQEFVRTLSTKEFPPDITGRQEALLSSINANTKSVTLLLIPGERRISFNELSRTFKKIYEGTEFERVDNSTILAYCNYFSKVGLVTKEEGFGKPVTKKTLLFSLTKNGEKFGKPVAALSLFFESKHRLSLFRIFGSTNKTISAEHRAPYHRATILQYLNEKGLTVRESDLVRDLEIPGPIVSRSLSALAKAGVVDFGEEMGVALAKINQSGQIVDSELLQEIQGLLTENIEVQNRIWSEVVPKVLEKLPVVAELNLPLYFERSHSYKMRQFKKNRAKVLAMIAQSPQGITARELANFVHLSPSAINHNLQPYVVQRQLFVDKRHGENHYYLLSAERWLRADRGRSIISWRSRVRSGEL